MPELAFEIESVRAMANSAAPVMAFALRIRAGGVEELHSISLNCQFHIQPARRQYSAGEQAALADLFGEPERWGTTLRPLFWTTVSVAVPPFRESTVIDIRVPCTFDFDIAVTKYFHAIEAGEIPVVLLFSGTILYQAGESVQMAPISWSQEASCRVPAAVWKEMIALHSPNSAWLYLQRDIFERMYRYKVRHGLPTWDQAIERVLDTAESSEKARVNHAA